MKAMQADGDWVLLHFWDRYERAILLPIVFIFVVAFMCSSAVCRCEYFFIVVH